MDYLERVEALSVPVLLFHGSEDTRVPVWLSDRLAVARPDLVEYEVFDGAIPRGTWNQDRERYEQAVRRFLTVMEHAVAKSVRVFQCHPVTAHALAARLGRAGGSAPVCF